jgi:hypothetical protein
MLYPDFRVNQLTFNLSIFVRIRIFKTIGKTTWYVISPERKK